LTYAINTNERIQSVTVSNSKFNTLYQGVVLGDGAVIAGGPQGVRVQNSIFDRVFREGIVYENVNTCVSANNIFFNVGNDFTTSPTVSIILFGNDNNVSVSDMFERTLDEVLVHPRVRILGVGSSTGTLIQLGRYTRNSGRTFNLADNQSVQPVFQISTTLTRAFTMNYTIVRATAVRHGTLTVTAQSYFNDEYTENFDTGVTLSVSTVDTVVTVSYSTTSVGQAAVLTYSIFNLA
jgi:hypothetical protein